MTMKGKGIRSKIRRTWSRDWANFDWNDVCAEFVKGKEVKEKTENFETKLTETKLSEKKGSAAEAVRSGIGITEDEFIEYLEWLAENHPEQYRKAVLGIKLHELGVEPMLAQYMCENSQQFLKAFGIMKRDKPN